MKKILLTAIVAAFGLLSSQAYAANAACEAKAVDKNGKALAGAAKTSFLKKCEKDSGAAAAAGSPACEKTAADKKLHGAAKNSFVKKCTADEKAGAQPAASAAKK